MNFVPRPKAKNTFYNGCYFRSRLEARWAVFFDELGIRYQYELEGFKIKNYSKQKTWHYLPDFYLPDFKTWVEVKGPFADLDISYWDMIANALDWKSQMPNKENGIVFLTDLPKILDYKRYSSECHVIYPRIHWRKGVYLSTTGITENEFQDYQRLIEYADASWGNMEAGKVLHKAIQFHITRFGIPAMAPGKESEQVFNAFIAANSARFEHGETPIAKSKIVD